MYQPQFISITNKEFDNNKCMKRFNIKIEKSAIITLLSTQCSLSNIFNRLGVAGSQT